MRMWSPRKSKQQNVGKAPLSSQGPYKPFAEAARGRSFTRGDQEVEVSSQNDSLTLPPTTPTDTSRGGVDEPVAVQADVSFPLYTITNLTYDRTYNANGSSTGELADVLGTLIRDVRTMLNELNRRLRDARETR
jgi:hypothetical protein